MKVVFIVIAIFISCSICFAQQPVNKDQKPQEKFETYKQKTLSNIDTRIAVLQQEKTCISSAQNKDDLKKCNEQAQQARKDMIEKYKQERAQQKKQ